LTSLDELHHCCVPEKKSETYISGIATLRKHSLPLTVKKQKGKKCRFIKGSMFNKIPQTINEL
jgi:hypothetical protein